jgi:hypothetical protein
VTTADTVMVDWPSRKRSLLTAVAASQILLVDEAGAVGVPEGEAAPRALALARARPNPASGPVTFEVDVPREAIGVPATLDVYSISGRHVARPFAGRLPAGRGRLVWDLRGDGGARVAPGLYFVRLRAGPAAAVRKVAVISPGP